MNFTKNQADDLNLVISLDIVKDDYAPAVEKTLRGYRQKANMPGFRPGHVPDSVIRKLYGKAVLVEEINKIVSESLSKYLTDENIDYLGDPMPSTDGDDIDWEIGNDFHFDFELGLAPAIDVKLSKKDKLTKYNITVAKEMIERNVDNYTSRYGHFEDIDAVVGLSEKLSGDICQLDGDKKPLEGGLSAEDSTILLTLIKDEALKKPFEGAKIGDSIDFVLADTFPNQWEISSILRKKNADEVGDIAGISFRFTVKAISTFVKAELNQELFDNVFGENAVTSREEFEDRIKSDIAANFEEASMEKFGDDVRLYLVEKIAPVLPESFLRKWLWNNNKDSISEADFEKKLPAFMKEIQWSVISGAITKANDIKVEEPEIVEAAKDIVRRQFSSYGIASFPDEELTNYAMNYLKNEKNVRGLVHRLLDQKVTKVVMAAVEVEEKDVTPEEYNDMMTPPNTESAEPTAES